MKIHIKFFAAHKQAVGKSEIEIELEPKTTVDKMRAILMDKYPKLKKYEKLTLITRNKEHARRSDVLKDGDEVAIFPPMGGGGIFKLT